MVKNSNKESNNSLMPIVKLFFVLSILILIASIILTIFLASTKNQNWWVGLTWTISSLFSVIFIVIIYDSLTRISKIEFLLNANGIKPKKDSINENTNIEENTNIFKKGEPIRLRSNNMTGMIKKVLDSNRYEIELDNDLGIFLIVNEEDIKSYFDI